MQISGTELLMEFIGDGSEAAPRLAQSRARGVELYDLFAKVLDVLIGFARAGFAHGDLSAYNMLWWDDRLWFIDFPQAVDIAENPSGLDFLHRDVLNVCDWFKRRGLLTFVWVVNDERRMNELVAADIDGLITDRLDIMRVLGRGIAGVPR